MIEKSKKYLIDSNIIIYHLNGEKIAIDFLESYFEESCISRLTFLEVLSFDFSNEDKKYVLKMLNSFEIIDTNENIILQALKNILQMISYRTSVVLLFYLMILV